MTASGLTGYVWSQSYGWINLDPTNGGVTNDSEGRLSGYAWGQDVGWISFQGAVINSSGQFTGIIGTASSTAGRISFNCTYCDVETDWRPMVPVIQVGGGGEGGGGYTTVVGASSSSLLSPSTSPMTANPTNTSDLETLLASLEARLAELELEAGISPSSPPAYIFKRNLSYGTTGVDVNELQKYLVAHDVGAAARKLKAHGFTQNFASLTLAALVEFQRIAGIRPASGYFGPISRTFVNMHP